jgi:hypothetical protein
MAGPIRQHFQHMCLRERGHVFENLLSEPEQLASYNTSALDQEWRGASRFVCLVAHESKFHRGVFGAILPELSNFYCHPGRAGGTPLVNRFKDFWQE